MNKWNDLENSSEFEYSEEYFEKMLEEMENDPEFQTFTVPDEWDREFRKTIEETLKKEKKKRMKRYVKIGGMAACVVLAMTLALNVRTEQVQGEGLLEVFQNTFNLNGKRYVMYGTDEQLDMGVEEDIDDVFFNGTCLNEIYEQMREEVKSPIFYTDDVFDEYEVKESVYNKTYRMLNIELETSEGRVFMSQEQMVKESASGIVTEDEECARVYNKNLEEDIVIYKSIQSDYYAFSVKRKQNILAFRGSISLEKCKELAESIQFE